MKLPEQTTILALPGTTLGIELGPLEIVGAERHGDQVVHRFKQQTHPVRRDEDGHWTRLAEPLPDVRATNADLREAAENLARKVEWAYEDACFTAPEDTERMNRHWRVITEALRGYRDIVPKEAG